MKVRIAPLSGGFMIASMIGFLISILFVYRKMSVSYGAAFSIVFLIMFIASIISFVYAPLEEYPHSGRKS